MARASWRDTAQRRTQPIDRMKKTWRDLVMATLPERHVPED